MDLKTLFALAEEKKKGKRPSSSQHSPSKHETTTTTSHPQNVNGTAHKETKATSPSTSTFKRSSRQIVKRAGQSKSAVEPQDQPMEINSPISSSQSSPTKRRRRSGETSKEAPTPTSSPSKRGRRPKAKKESKIQDDTDDDEGEEEIVSPVHHDHRRPLTVSEDDDIPPTTVKIEEVYISSSPQTVETTNVERIAIPEKKRFNYQEFKQRGGARNPGTYEIPIGAPNCLQGLSFVFTGELEELSRDAASDLVKRYGGRVVTAPSGRTSFVVMGDDPGHGKLEKVKALGIPLLNEEQFYKLIVSSSAQPTTVEGTLPSSPVKRLPAPSSHITTPQEPPSRTFTLAQPCGLWTSKYAPRDVSEIIGNQGAIGKLRSWLKEWTRSRSTSHSIKAALLSGPPGIGKSTAATLAAKSEGLQVLEYNASDTRSKKHLHEAILDLLNNHSISEFPVPGKLNLKDKKRGTGTSSNEEQKSERCVIIMDEVDGMSSGDRGGIAELIQLLKKTLVPMIFICNDRNSPKIRSLANYCLDLRFRRSDHRQIFPRIQEICKLEGLNISPNSIDELVASTHGDIRQIINALSTWKILNNSLSFDDAKHISKMSQKDTERGPFDIVPEFLSHSNYEKHSLNDLNEFYFSDSSLIPLMIQENYLLCVPFFAKSASPSQLDYLRRYADAADAIATADVVDKRIHGSNQEWSLAPFHGFLSCTLPAHYVSGSIGGRIEFASWLGQNSKTLKNNRLLLEISVHMSLHTSGGKSDVRASYLPALIEAITDPLFKDGVAGVDRVIQILEAYTLLKEDYDSLFELMIGRLSSDQLLGKIPTNVKSAVTRQYNKESPCLPYSTNINFKKSDLVGGFGAEDRAEEEEEASGEARIEVDEGEDEADLSKDKMVKAKTGGGGSRSGGKRAAPAKPTGVGRKARVGHPEPDLAKLTKQGYEEDDFVVEDDEMDEVYGRHKGARSKKTRH